MAMATTFSEDETTEKHVDHLSHLSRPSPQTVTSNALPHYGRPQPTLLQHSPAQYAPSQYPQFGYSNALTTPQSAAFVSDSMSSTVLPPPGMHQPGMANTYPAAMDTTGQIAPPGMKPRVTATLWEDEGSFCFQVESRGICVARREDNHMINGTNLLNVAGMTRGRRDGVLKSEKVRHVVEIGPLHLKGVWIPFGRALDFANQERITEMLYPLFVHNIGALLYHPVNQANANQIMVAAERPKAEAGGQMRNDTVSITSAVPMLIDTWAGKAGSIPQTPESSNYDQLSDHNESSDYDEICLPKQSGLNETVWKSGDIAPGCTTARTINPSQGYYSQQTGYNSPPRVQSSSNLYNIMSGPVAPAAIASSQDVYAFGKAKNEEYVSYHHEKKHIVCQSNIPARYDTARKSDDEAIKAPRQLIIASDQSAGKSRFLESLNELSSSEDQQRDTRFAVEITSRRTTGSAYAEKKESEYVHTQVGNLSPSQNSPQSDSEQSSDSEAGLLTRNERRGILLERLMAYFFELLSSCPSPVPITTAESPMMPNAGNRPQPTEDETTPAPLPPLEFSDQSMDRQASLSVPHSQSVLRNYPCRALSLNDDDYQEYTDQDDGPAKDGRDPAASQSKISGSVAASENRQSCVSHQSNRFIQKRDREEEDDDKDERQPGKRTRIDNDKNSAPKRLACPYFKNDPEHLRLGRSCSGPGWGTVHRLKEHLDRNHALPPSCVRCYTAFDTEVDRDTHMRMQDQCQVRERPGRMHGFDAAQKEQLRSRPKGYKHMSETQKWCHIYMILFPGTASTEIPSPYYEFVSFRDSGHPVDPMTEYENFLRHEMPDRVRHQLELRIEEALNPLEETLRGQIVDIVRDVQLELFQSFRASTGPTRPNGDSVRESASIEIDDNPDKDQDEKREDTDAQDSTLVARNTEPPGQFDSGQCSWEEQLEAYRQVPPLDISFTDFDDFDGALFDFSSVIPAAQDSAYGTLSISQEETDKDEFIGNGTGT